MESNGNSRGYSNICMEREKERERERER